MGILSVLPKAFGYCKRALNLAPEFLIGTGSEAVGRGMKAAGKNASIWTRVKAGGKALEADIAKKSVKGGFFKRTFKELLSTPKAVLSSSKAGVRLAKITGKSTAAGAAKGVLKALAKRMPLIGAVLTVAIEAPNIIKAFKEGGVKAGIKELGGAGVELGCMAAGAAIGSCAGPVGTVVGGIIGGIVGMFARGKTYSDKKAEQEQQQEAVQYTDQETAALKQYGFTDEEIAQLQQNGYTMQDIEALLKQEAVQYTDREISALKQYGFTDEEIAQLQQYGYTMQDVETLLEQEQQQYINAQDKTNVSSAAQDKSDEELLNYYPSYYYPDTTINPYTSYQNPYMMPSYYNPYMTDLYNTNINGYSNDILYKQLFGGYTNPYFVYNPYQYCYTA